MMSSQGSIPAAQDDSKLRAPMDSDSGLSDAEAPRAVYQFEFE